MYPFVIPLKSLFLGDILPEESVHVFYGALFPRRVWMCEINGCIEFFCYNLVCCKLTSIVRGSGSYGHPRPFQQPYYNMRKGNSLPSRFEFFHI